MDLAQIKQASSVSSKGFQPFPEIYPIPAGSMRAVCWPNSAAGAMPVRGPATFRPTRPRMICLTSSKYSKPTSPTERRWAGPKKTGRNPHQIAALIK